MKKTVIAFFVTLLVHILINYVLRVINSFDGVFVGYFLGLILGLMLFGLDDLKPVGKGIALGSVFSFIVTVGMYLNYVSNFG